MTRASGIAKAMDAAIANGHGKDDLGAIAAEVIRVRAGRDGQDGRDGREGQVGPGRAGWGRCGRTGEVGRAVRAGAEGLHDNRRRLRSAGLQACRRATTRESARGRTSRCRRRSSR